MQKRSSRETAKLDLHIRFNTLHNQAQQLRELAKHIKGKHD